MEKLHYYKKSKSVIKLYLFLIALLSLLIMRQILLYPQGESLKNVFNETIKKIPIELFVQSAFHLSPNLEYISTTNTNETTQALNPYMPFTHSYIPILSYMVEKGITSGGSIFENYPYLNLNSETAETIAMNEKFNMDSLERGKPSASGFQYSLEQLSNYDFMLQNLYTVDSYITVNKNIFDIPYFYNSDQKIDLSQKGPKVLIYHTHSQEAFIDSRAGEKADTIVGVGEELKKLLEEEYGLEVLHLKKEFDVTNGKPNRNNAYERAEKDLKTIIKENPTIEIMIDLHRDGVLGTKKFVTTIDNKPTAMIMFFNGLSKMMENGELVNIKSTPNPYVKENMAFSFQMHMKAGALYPGFTRKIYLKSARYNLHIKPKSLLVEVGVQNNTVQEAKNAMEPLAKILYEVIK